MQIPIPLPVSYNEERCTVSPSLCIIVRVYGPQIEFLPIIALSLYQSGLTNLRIIGIQGRHWAKEVITRTKKRDSVINNRFIKKKINRLTNNIAQESATITNLQIQLTTKRVEYDLPPKFITNADFTFRIDESIIGKEEAQILYDQMRQLIKEYRMQTMSLYLQSTTREREIITDEMKNIIQDILPENDERFNGEENPGSLAFKHYNDLREKRLNLEAEQSLYFLEEQQVEGEVNEQDEIVAPTLTRSLGEDFSLQL
ncbi:unnamed protein product [Rotaria socialis]|uniref:Uncharacterized protein n=2 Tax=Rotaria socialis TaxID=392032 RepID=A0A820SXH6_9BILA|nr:unnamed protein product [Rotaria socialis]